MTMEWDNIDRTSWDAWNEDGKKVNTYFAYKILCRKMFDKPLSFKGVYSLVWKDIIDCKMR